MFGAMSAAGNGGGRRRPRRRRRRFRNYKGQPEILSLFARAGSNLQGAGEHINELLASWPEDRGLRRQITIFEHEGDEITRRIIRALHEARLTPYERGGAYALAEAIDDVVDEIEEVSEDLAVYGIEAPMTQAQELASVVRDAGRAVRRALDRFRDGAGLGAEFVEVRDLEHEGDRVYREGLVALFEGGVDPMMVIRWKDVFDGLENAVDRARQAMDILRGMAVSGRSDS
jgi:predicted phosphate transport protein (TIGR00153 family)